MIRIQIKRRERQIMHAELIETQRAKGREEFQRSLPRIKFPNSAIDAMNQDIDPGAGNI